MLLVKRKILQNLAVNCTLATLAAFPIVGCTQTDVLNEPQVVDAGATAAIEASAARAAPSQELINQRREELQKALPAGVSLKYLSELSLIYAASDEMKPLWEDEKAMKAFQSQLAEVALSGVNGQFGQWATLLSNPELTGIGRDAVLSDAMLGYLHFVNGVYANGNRWLYRADSYKMAAPAKAEIEQWQQAVGEGRLDAFVQGLAPKNPQYEKMRAAMLPLINDAQPWPQLATAKQSLRPGNSSKDVPELREILTRSGLLEKAAAAGAEDQNAAKAKASLVYSSDLVEAVKKFQKMYGLEADGVIGNSTREALNMAPQTRAAVLALNIQRLRLLPAAWDHGVFVNIPDYSLVYYVNGERILESRVIVGSVRRKTPLMSSAMNNVVVNPPWNVPAKLIKEDLVPKAKRDAEYLKRQGYTVYAGYGKNAEAVDPSTIDWSEGSGNYRLQQAPGSGNALGRFKFNMPNDDAIYLHDTPNHRLFDKSMRALSSGCIRVNKAAELANMLLNDAGWDDNKIQNTLKRGSTTYAQIREKIPVQLYYLTSWVSADGQPEFRSDIYGYDRLAQAGVKELPQIEKLLH
ncbi:L,D-transpeptidase [Leminorella grimontii]|uniref:L,D-transpeptidase n=1 Tax=Leminorella grimontii TaxID=82981 RepID=A0AAV5N1Y6_9GAMM|nr:L,D-transpeptidase [Leminorella grimontii]KFC96623.1 L,D-transpeptidase [Leminorella grimontii ATCC 33999 = DSM 5078]GKX56130.1 L,D-transpeptidase [Leminorella grimontii]VFS57945.1 murein L,D-transpeptidase [Leminorella grimontii]